MSVSVLNNHLGSVLYNSLSVIVSSSPGFSSSAVFTEATVTIFPLSLVQHCCSSLMRVSYMVIYSAIELLFLVLRSVSRWDRLP